MPPHNTGSVPTDPSAGTFKTVVISVVISLVSLFLILTLFFRIGWLQLNQSEGSAVNGKLIGFYLLAAFFGAGVGASEIVSRYRDEPFNTLLTPPALSYLLLNALISAAAFFLLVHYQGQIFSGLRQDLFLTSFVAGFGAMVVMRSKLFSFKTEGGSETFSVGPEAVLVIFLSSVDRQIDRQRAAQRQVLVFKETMQISDPANAPDFLRAFLVSYQNLTNDEKAKINNEIKSAYASPDLKTPLLKFMAVAFAFLNIMGEKNFKSIISLLKQFQKSTSSRCARITAALRVLNTRARVDTARDLTSLVLQEVCEASINQHVGVGIGEDTSRRRF
jgi:hypothetical protein